MKKNGDRQFIRRLRRRLPRREKTARRRKTQCFARRAAKYFST